MKKKITVLSLLAICAALTASGTLAYFTSEGKAHNVITTGGVSIELIEKTVSDGTKVEFPKEGISGVMPGTSVSKIVTVKNDGAADAWIRVKVDQEITNPDKNPLPLTIGEGEKADPVMSFEVDSEKWTYEGGYYYYKLPVSPMGEDEDGVLLFDEVLFSGAMGNEYQNCTAKIFVSAEAVQYANNPIPEGGTVTDIPGWPEPAAPEEP